MVGDGVLGPGPKLKARPDRRLLNVRRLAVLPQPPAIDRFDVESPIAAYLERWQATAFELTIDGRRMNFQVVRKLLHGQNPAVLFDKHKLVPPSLVPLGADCPARAIT